MKKLYRLKVLAVALIIAAAGFIPAVAYSNDAKLYEEGIIEYNLQKSSADSVQEWIDSDLTHDAGTGSEWYIIALSNHGKYDFSQYKTALNNYLSENEVGSASSRLKYALTYIAIEDNANPYIDEVLGNSIGEQGIMSFVFGLHLLNNGCVSDAYSLNGLINELLALQLADGGWTVTGEYGDVDVTAMTVQALAVHYDNSAVKSAVDDALNFLSARQLENGGYSAYGVENPESSAQVVIALSSLDIDVIEDNRFIKNGNTIFDGMKSFRLEDGSFCHRKGSASDSMASSQVLCASIAYENMKNGKPLFYTFNKNTDEETTTQAVITEEISVSQSTMPESSATTEKTDFDLETSDITLSEFYNKKSEPAEIRKDKTNSVKLAVISVCIVSILICAVLFATKKYKIAVFVIIIAVTAIAMTVNISDKDNSDIIGSVTISINCDVIKNEDKSYIPANGIILEKTEVEIEDGDTVYDVFSEICRKNNILFSANMGYIEGINNIYEMDFGKSSGWVYFVNGESPSVGCESYELSDGDEIQWCYTRNPGADLDMHFKNEYN